MALFRWEDTGLKSVEGHALEDKNVKERKLQDALMANPDPLEKGLFIIATEFGDWEDSRRRIDLLALDDKARLVVVELKRSQTGDHAELQAIRYAAMVSNMTRDRIIRAHSDYLKRKAKTPQLPRHGGDGNDGEGADIEGYKIAEERLTEHLKKVLEKTTETESETKLELSDISVSTELPRIILASAGFSQELTTSVLWLVENYELDITCVELQLYETDQGKQFLIDNRIIPLPGDEYRTKAKEYKKERREQERKSSVPNFRFSMVGIENGEEVHWKDNPAIKCEVHDATLNRRAVKLKEESKTIYEETAKERPPDGPRSLSSLAGSLLGKSVNGTLHWCYNEGETLSELRQLWELRQKEGGAPRSGKS